jgi:hypothetical protein
LNDGRHGCLFLLAVLRSIVTREAFKWAGD